MFKKLLNWLQKDQQSELDAYITSKNPQNVADVDHWVRQYNQLWTRGV
jgi:hypothetical protein